MTTLQALRFTAQVQIGSLIKSNNMVLRVDAIKENSFEGQVIYKGKERGLTTLSFETLLNPHYGKDIKIINF